MPKRHLGDGMEPFAKEDDEESDEKYDGQAVSSSVVINEAPAIISIDYADYLTPVDLHHHGGGHVDGGGTPAHGLDGSGGRGYERITSMGSVTISSVMSEALTDSMVSGSKSPKRKKYEQKYRSIWEKDHRFRDWIAPVPNNSGRAYCKYCTCEVKAHIACLTRHNNSLKHLEQINDEPQFPQLGSSVKIAELRLAAYTAEHNSIHLSEQLVDLFQSCVRDSKIAQELKMNRIKSQTLIDTILAPSFRVALVKDIGKSHFSIFIDESTDISVHKTLGLVIRYVSYSQQKLVTTFYRLLLLDNTDAHSIAEKILSAFCEDNLDIKKLIGVGTDNASVVMTGDQNSVFTKLKQFCPNLFLMKCVCHSLQAACSFATEVLPGQLELLAQDTYFWFNESPKRQLRFSDVYRQLFGHLTHLQSSKKVDRPDGNRWLSCYEWVSTILENWDSLYLHFLHAKDAERCHKAAQLVELYKDKKNAVYFTFLKLILKDFSMLNQQFQNEGENNQMKLCEELLSFYEKILYRIVQPERFEKISISELAIFNFIEFLRPLKMIDFGDQFRLLIDCFPTDHQMEIMKKCRDFLVEAAFQVKSRLPENIEVLCHLTHLEPEKVLGFRPPNVERLLREVQFAPLDVDQALNEYQLIRRREWSEILDPVKFWLEVQENKYNFSTLGFQNIASYALTLFTLPLSNSSVEKIFSQITQIKTKCRNHSEIKLRDSILAVKYGLDFMQKTSSDFLVTEEMLKKFDSFMYLFESSTWDSDDALDLELEPLL